MLTAKQAREQVDSIENTCNKRQLELIAQQINDAVLRGESYISFDNSLTKANKAYLESRDMGYKVEYHSGDQRDYTPGYYSISW